MTFGVTPDGFKRKVLTDILKEIEDQQRTKISPSLNLLPSSLLGQINGVFSDKLRELWDVAIAVYRSQYPDTASGDALDNVAAITGAQRLPERSSKVLLSLNLDDGTTVAAGKVVSIGANGARWITQTPVTNATGAQATFQVEALSKETGPVNGSSFTIDTIVTPVSGWVAKAAINSQNQEPFRLKKNDTLMVQIDDRMTQTVTFKTADFAEITNATALEVAKAIKKAFRDAKYGLDAIDANGFVRIVSERNGTGSAVQIVGGTSIEVLGFSSAKARGFNPDAPARNCSATAEPFSLADGETLNIRIDGGPIQMITFNTADFEAIGAASAIEVARAINADITDAAAYSAGGKVQIESLSGGSASTVEVIGGAASTVLTIAEWVRGIDGDAEPGRKVETDAEFRVRRNELLRISGSATLEAVRAHVRRVVGVSQAFVFENTGRDKKHDLPPNSLEVVVSGGEDEDIARAIFNHKPIGIETFGLETIPVNDTQGFPHEIHFNRPTVRNIFVAMTVEVDAAVFPMDGVKQIRDRVIEGGQKLAVGEDIYALTFKCIPLEVAGVKDVPDFRIDIASPPAQSRNIEIPFRELAQFDSVEVEVEVVQL